MTSRTLHFVDKLSLKEKYGGEQRKISALSAPALRKFSDRARPPQARAKLQRVTLAQKATSSLSSGMERSLRPFRACAMPAGKSYLAFVNVPGNSAASETCPSREPEIWESALCCQDVPPARALQWGAAANRMRWVGALLGSMLPGPEVEERAEPPPSAPAQARKARVPVGGRHHNSPAVTLWSEFARRVAQIQVEAASNGFADPEPSRPGQPGLGRLSTKRRQPRGISTTVGWCTVGKGGNHRGRARGQECRRRRKRPGGESRLARGTIRPGKGHSSVVAFHVGF